MASIRSTSMPGCRLALPPVLPMGGSAHVVIQRFLFSAAKVGRNSEKTKGTRAFFEKNT
jgi:hypothetical protein